MKQAKKLDQRDRDRIAGFLNEDGRGVREIARLMNRSPGTISEEIAKNSVNGVYHAKKAHEKARQRKRTGKHGFRKIDADPELKRYIVKKLKAKWNPDEISGRMKREGQPFYASKTAIYGWLRTVRGERYCRYLYSKRRYVKKRKPKTTRTLIPNRVGIAQRPVGATNRTRYGHWETDAVVSGKRGSGALSVSRERKSGLTRLTLCASMSPSEHVQAHKRVAKNHKTLSMTFDNGIENAKHARVRAVGTSTYFCDPYSSWQKPGVESENRVVRQDFPTGTNFATVSVAAVQATEDRLNDKPRKRLGYRTPREVATAAGVVL